MKRAFILILAMACVLVGVNACGTEADGSRNRSESSLLSMLPRDATGVFYVDVQRVMNSPVGKKALEDNDHDLADFTRETGIDLSRDVYGLAGVVSGETKEEAKGAVVLNMSYDRSAVKAKIQDENPSVKFETYEGTEYVDLPPQPGEDPSQVAFLDDDHLVFGSPEHVRRVIDVTRKGADSVEENADLMAAAKGIDRGSMLWGVFAIPVSASKELETNPMLGSLAGLRTLVMSFDYQDAALLGEIVGNTGSEDTSRQIADMLTGLKAFAAMGASEKPNMAEMLNGITITSRANEVRLSANIPERLLMNLETE